MKCVLVFVLLAVTAYAAVVPIPEDVPREYSRFIKFGGGDGEMHDVDLEAEPDHALLDEIYRNPANNAYILYTRANQKSGQTLKINDAKSVTNSNFNPKVPTVVIVHGWLSNQNTEPNPTVKKAYLDKSDVNIIVTDWKRLAMSDYATAALGAPAIGRGLGQFLAWLHNLTGASYNNLHLVGFSLGAHIVGNAGRELGGKAARVTGLDPAGPGWSLNSNRLKSTDGVYVEAIHTDGGAVGLGISSAVANADFFPNGGNSQPGCLTNLCNHNRSWELFAATVTLNHLVGRGCSSTTQVTWNTCKGSYFHMGNDDLKKWGTGLYRLDTSKKYPY